MESEFEAGGLKLVMRQIQQGELVQVREFCVGLNWAVSLDDLEAMYKPRPSAFIGAFNSHGHLISSIIAMALDKNLAYIGLFITAAEHRHKGIGKAVFNQAMDQLKGRNIQIESVPGKQMLYQKLGFSMSEKINFYVRGQAQPISGYSFPQEVDIHRVNNDNVCDIMPYDQVISSIDRSDHLPHWMLCNTAVTYAAFKDGHCVGFGSARKCGDLYKIQPLYAESTGIATALVQTLLIEDAVPPGSTAQLMSVVQNRSQVLSLGERFGLVEDTISLGYRLHFIQEIKFPWHKIFSTTNTENTII